MRVLYSKMRLQNNPSPEKQNSYGSDSLTSGNTTWNCLYVPLHILSWEENLLMLLDFIPIDKHDL